MRQIQDFLYNHQLITTTVVSFAYTLALVYSDYNNSSSFFWEFWDAKIVLFYGIAFVVLGVLLKYGKIKERKWLIILSRILLGILLAHLLALVIVYFGVRLGFWPTKFPFFDLSL